MTKLKRDLAIVTAPRWKLWYTSSRKQTSLTAIGEAFVSDPCAVIKLVMEHASFQPLRPSHPVRDALKRVVNDSIVRELVKCAAMELDVRGANFFANLFGAFEKNSSPAVDLLAHWVKVQRITDLPQPTDDQRSIHQLMGVAQAEVRANMSTRKQAEFGAIEAWLLAELRRNAAEALGRIGGAAARAIPSIRVGMALENEDWKRSSYQDAVERIEGEL